MSKLSDWLSVMSQTEATTTYNISGDINKLQELFTKNRYLPVSNRNVVNKGKPYFVMKGGSVSATGSTSKTSSVLKPLYVNAYTVPVTSSSSSSQTRSKKAMLRSGLGGTLALDIRPGYSMDALGNLISTGAAFISSKAFIYTAAAACGFSIGWGIADEIDRWLRENNFDWGVNSIQYETGLTDVLVLLTQEGAHAKTFIQHDLFERLIEKLDEWGLWDNRPAVTPYEPVIGEYVHYDFTNRFPDVPQSYVSRFQALINNYNIDINGKYITCAVSTDDHLRLVVFQSGYLAFDSRSDKFNNLLLVTPTEVCCSVHRGNLEEHVVAYDMTASGEMSIAWEHDIGYLPFTLRGGVDGWIFDNFGTDYREIVDGNVISAPTDDYNSIYEDPDAVDLRSGPLDVVAPTWWALRLALSIPDILQLPRAVAAAEPLNEQDIYIPVAIPKPIISELEQIRIWDDVTDDETAEDILDDTDDAIPKIGADPVPTPTNPPVPTPTVPDIHLSPWGVSDSGMISLYNPTSAELRDFSQWLWSINPTDLDNLKKLLQNPFDALIGLHQIYATPVKLQESKAHIILGRIDSEYPSDIIKQYTSVSCGGPVFIQPYTNNAHDYINVSVQLYLPFIGIVDLATAEVMNQWVKVSYQVDFLTGTCLAIVSLSRDNSNYYTAYTFPGNCAVQLPLTGGNYAAFLGNIVGLGMSAVGAAIGGGAGAAVGAAIGSTMNSASSGGILGGVSRSGGLGANAGAMGQKIPYLIISRHPAAEAYNRGALQGLPQNMRARLGSCVGYTKITNINLDSISCTEGEKEAIRAKLMGGVII